MKRFAVVWTATALNQLDDIYEYIAIDSEQAAGNVTSRILAATKRLYLFPLSGQEEEFLKELNHSYRYVVAGNYKIIYRLEDKVVYISAVFDTRQDPDKMKYFVS